MKQFLSIASWVLLTAGLVVVLGFVNQVQNKKVCTEIYIEIDNSNGNFFVEEQDIFAMVYHEMDTVVGRPISAIDAQKIERKINNHPSVSNSKVYKTIDGKLKVEVSQRMPIVRIFSMNGDSYYLDGTGKVMPSSSKYTSRVFVANGFINDSFKKVSHLNARMVTDSIQNRVLIDDIFTMAEFIRTDPLWHAQIEQLYVNKELEIELIPRVGNHRIVVGDATDIQTKFDKLKVFYRKGLSKTGWNEYSVINLKFANQVVCKKRL
jgi:cell division protein FtsQ